MYCSMCGYPLVKITEYTKEDYSEGYFYCNECKTKSSRFKGYDDRN